MAIWAKELTLEDLKQRNEGCMVTHLGIEFTEIGDDYLIARMPVDERTRQPMGIMHGGASCVLAETVGSNGANCVVDNDKTYCVGLDINTNHIKAMRSGYVYGRATPLHLGKLTQVWEIRITNENGSLVSINRLTMAVLDRSQRPNPGITTAGE